MRLSIHPRIGDSDNVSDPINSANPYNSPNKSEPPSHTLTDAGITRKVSTPTVKNSDSTISKIEPSVSTESPKVEKSDQNNNFIEEELVVNAIHNDDAKEVTVVDAPVSEDLEGESELEVELDMHVSQTQVHTDIVINAVVEMEVEENDEKEFVTSDCIASVHSESKENSKDGEDDEDYDEIDLHVSQTQVNLPADHVF